MRRRWPVASGTFYPGDPQRLRTEIAGCVGGDLGAPLGVLRSPVALILPHAGYRYSGAVAGAGYRALWRLGRPEAAIILGTNHTGLGGAITVGEAEAWETPLGSIPVDGRLAWEVAAALGAHQDDLPFAQEHSVEVHLPFLQHLFLGIPFVPIVVQELGRAEAEAAGTALARAVSHRPFVILASTDFTHYEPDSVAHEKDEVALRAILDLDLSTFLALVGKRRITICGVGAIALLLAAAQELGLRRTQLLSYRTSGDVGGPRDRVVGYAAVLFEKVESGA